MEDEGPRSPKKQKTEGADPVGGGEPTQSSLSRSVVTDVGELSGPAGSPLSTSSSSVNSEELEAGDTEPPVLDPYPLDCMSDEELCSNSAEDREILKNQTRSIAAVALDSYFDRQGVRYVLQEPVTSFCFLLERLVVCHANFTAKVEKLAFEHDSGSFSESSLVSPTPTPTPTELFFAETAQLIGGDIKVTSCCIIDPSSEPDSVRDGCLYCGRRRDPVFYHPRGGNWKYGCQDVFKV